jgi:hypothetical protein
VARRGRRESKMKYYIGGEQEHAKKDKEGN